MRLPDAAQSARNDVRVDRAASASLSATVERWGIAAWPAWCSTSPVMTPNSAPLVRRTEWCPGVWPGVGSRRTEAVSWWVLATSSARPASITGWTESSRMRRWSSSPAADQCSYSVRPKR